MTDLIPPHGGFRTLRSFITAQQVYDATVIFCNRFIDKRSRTHDQMTQAARSGVQNIAEGSLAAATSKKTELKLTSVARASLGELLLDYEDYLRQHGLRLWGKNSPEALKVRKKLSEKSDESDKPDGSAKSDLPDWLCLPADVFANTLICLINQASFLLWRQMQRLEQDFIKEGGFTERLYNVRKAARAKQ
ncbi:MAG: four helix bundle suffix domain-containing protein [Chitinivibrionales bacterium]|nr:four helix bundle suffix domain-containing protein [Chitinivibrionales bacterium]